MGEFFMTFLFCIFCLIVLLSIFSFFITLYELANDFLRFYCHECNRTIWFFQKKTVDKKFMGHYTEVDYQCRKCKKRNVEELFYVLSRGKEYLDRIGFNSGKGGR